MNNEDCVTRATRAFPLVPLTREGRAFAEKLNALVNGNVGMWNQVEGEARLNSARRKDGHLWRPVRKALVLGG